MSFVRHVVRIFLVITLKQLFLLTILGMNCLGGGSLVLSQLLVDTFFYSFQSN